VINLATTAEESGQSELAIEYFMILLKVGNVDEQDLAREHIEKLTKSE
jgi:hypothetical protein